MTVRGVKRDFPLCLPEGFMAKWSRNQDDAIALFPGSSVWCSGNL